jgi:O-antigen/teichoic acid export membrane protein
MFHEKGYVIDRTRVFNNALWTFAGQIFPLVIVLMTLPFFIRCLGVERFGAFTLIFAFFTYLNLFDLGVSVGLTRFLARAIAAGNDKEFRELTDTALLMLFILGCGGAIVAFCTIPFILRFLHLSNVLYNEMRDALIILLVALPMSLYSGGLRSVLNARQRMELVNILEITLAVSRTLGMLLIAAFNNDLRWIVAFFCLTQIIVFFLYSYCAAPFIPGEKGHGLPDMKKVYIFFQYGGWLTVSNIISPVMVYFDRFLLGAILSIAVIPYYSIPYDIVTKLWVFPATICVPFFPVLSALYSRDLMASKLIFMKMVRFLFISLFPLILFAGIFAREGMTLWMGEEFAEKSYIILQWLSVGVLTNSLAQLAYNYILASGRTDLPAKFHLIELCLYLPMLFILIKKFGLKGAAVAWVLRVSVDAVLLFVALIRLTRLELRYVKEIINCFLISITLLMVAFIHTGVKWKLGYWFAAVVLFSVWLWRFVMDREDRLWVKGLLRQRLA